MRVLLLGATGTIGQATVKALVQAGHEVVCLVRDKSGGDGTGNTTAMQMSLKGAETHFGDVLDIQSVLAEKWLQQPFDALVSCLASRNGTPRDAWAIDYQAHSAWLQLAKTKGIKQFVLLSALCVQKPLLEFQRAKLAFENELVAIGFFIKKRNQLLYLKGIVTSSGKKIGAMQALFDKVIQENHESCIGLDFGGSSDEGLASFNKKFGACDRNYLILKQNKLPWPLNNVVKRKLGI